MRKDAFDKKVKNSVRDTTVFFTGDLSVLLGVRRTTMMGTRPFTARFKEFRPIIAPTSPARSLHSRQKGTIVSAGGYEK